MHAFHIDSKRSEMSYLGLALSFDRAYLYEL
jgi:hypothetical protein